MPDTFASTFRDMPRSARMVRTRWPSCSRKLVSGSGCSVIGSALGGFAGRIMPIRIDSKRGRWLSMNYNSESWGRRRVSSYNAVTWLLDRNVDEGRAGKLAFTDTVSDLTYGHLQTQSRRLANLLRR